MTDYDSRRTGNGLLDTGSTPVYSTRQGRNEPTGFDSHRIKSSVRPAKYAGLGNYLIKSIQKGTQAKRKESCLHKLS